MKHTELYQKLCLEWSDRNKSPLDSYKANSKESGWWVCPKGHEWQASIKDRVRGQGCPYCKGRIPHPDDNLATALPRVATLWNYDRNTSGPEDYRPHSGKIVWWKCKKGHEWNATIKSMSRIRTTNGCPYCSGELPIKGASDLATLHPELALEWDYEKNKKDPSE